METFRSSSSTDNEERSGATTGAYHDSQPPRADSGMSPLVTDVMYLDCDFTGTELVKKSRCSGSHEPRHLPESAVKGDTHENPAGVTQSAPEPRAVHCSGDSEVTHEHRENEPDREPTDKTGPDKETEASSFDLTQDMRPRRNAAARLPFYATAAVLVLLISLITYLTYCNDLRFGSEPIVSPPSSREAQGTVNRIPHIDAQEPDTLPSAAQLPSSKRTPSPGNAITDLHAKKPADTAAPGFQSSTWKTVSRSPGEKERPALSGHENKAAAVAPEEESSGDSVSLETILSHLQVVELQQKGYELALDLMNSRSGAFSGFFPDRSIPGVSYVRKFESRIVELEMKKKALAVQFNPNSREIQSIDQEIKGIRDSVKDYIREQLVFVQKQKQSLVAQKSALERRVGIGGPSRTGSTVIWPTHDSSSEGTENLWVHEEQPDPGRLMSVNLDRVVSRVSSGLTSLVGQTKEKLKSFPFSCSVDVEDMPQ